MVDSHRYSLTALYVIENSYVRTFYASANCFNRYIILGLCIYCIVVNIVDFLVWSGLFFQTTEVGKTTRFVILCDCLWSLAVACLGLRYDPMAFCKSFDEIWNRLSFYRYASSFHFFDSEIKISNKNALIYVILSTQKLVVIGILTVDPSNNLEMIRFLGRMLKDLSTIFLSLIIYRCLSLAILLINIGQQCLEFKIMQTKFIEQTSGNYMLICRAQHFKLLKLTQLVDKKFNTYYSCFISILFPQIVATAYNLLFGGLAIRGVLIYSSSIVNLTSGMYFLTKCCLMLHKSPIKPYEAIYRCSLVNRSNDFKVQVSLFMDMVNRKKFGIHYMNLFLITPDSITTLGALAFTYILAIPNFTNNSSPS